MFSVDSQDTRQACEATYYTNGAVIPCVSRDDAGSHVIGPEDRMFDSFLSPGLVYSNFPPPLPPGFLIHGAQITKAIGRPDQRALDDPDAQGRHVRDRPIPSTSFNLLFLHLQKSCTELMSEKLPSSLHCDQNSSVSPCLGSRTGPSDFVSRCIVRHS